MLLWSGSMRWKLSHVWHSHRINWTKTGNLLKDLGARITPSAASGTTDSAFLCACHIRVGRGCLCATSRQCRQYSNDVPMLL